MKRDEERYESYLLARTSLLKYRLNILLAQVLHKTLFRGDQILGEFQFALLQQEASADRALSPD